MDESTAPIAEARHTAGLSQRELADRIGVPLWTVDQIERGEVDVRPYLLAIATATGQPAQQLLREAPQPIEPVTPEEPAAEETEPVHAAEGTWVRNVICASVVALVVIRFFAEDLGVVPAAVKLVDLPILAVLLLLAWVAPRRAEPGIRSIRYLLAASVFVAVCIASVLMNSGRVDITPVLLFIYGFIGPILIFYLVRALWPVGNTLTMSRLLVGLACLQLGVVLFVDVPEYLKDTNPDVVSGTFGENAYQLVFFLLMCSALVAGIVTLERRRLIARFAPFFFAGAAGAILLAQYRAILLTAALTVVLLATILGLVRVRGAVAGVLVGIVFLVGVSVIPSIFPELKLQKTVDTLTGDPGSYVEKRLEAGSDVLDLYTEKPETIVFGSGPGTFNSRAWETFYGPTEAGGFRELLSFAPVGFPSDVSRRYTFPRLRNQRTVEGSFALVTPFASYYALLAEVGVVGFLLLVGMYGLVLVDSIRMSVTALRRAPDGDPLPGLLLASTAGFFVLLQMGILENWWEVTRITFIVWIVFAVASKEFEARYGESAGARKALQ